jgi:hypothetical protein
VEAGRWRLSVGDTWIDENSEIETIDEILTAILGSRLGDFSITSSGALTVSISNNSRLSIQPAARADQLSEWILFRRERWSLAFESGAALLDVQRHIDVGDG